MELRISYKMDKQIQLWPEKTPLINIRYTHRRLKVLFALLLRNTLSAKYRIGIN